MTMRFLSSSILKPLRRFVRWCGRRLRLVIAVLILVAAVAGSLALYDPPARFPVGGIFHISEGSSITSVADDLQSQGFVASAFVFEKLVVALGKEKDIIAGDYYFPVKSNVYDMARRITGGIYGLVPVRVTLPEGLTANEMADLLEAKLPGFDRASFLAAAKGKEGYLFPDTYFFMPNESADEIVTTLRDTFQDKVKPSYPDIIASKRSFSDIVTVASIVEKEASTPEDRRIVAGIIWKRLDKGMLLQIDATLGYVLNKGTFELTQSDLKLDNPYNTYLYKGLPPTPIGNPGLDAIDAAIHPTETSYLYYLSDKDGVIHYAKTFEEHKKNRELYLEK